MINGPRRSRIGWNPTEIEASKVGKTRKTPGFPGHRFFATYCDTLFAESGRCLDATEVRDLFRAVDATLFAAASCYMVGTDVVESRDVDFAAVEHVLDPKIQKHWNTRCWVINLVERVYAHDMRPDEGLDAATRLARREATAILGRTLAGILLA